MIRCSAKENLIKQLKELQPSEPTFSQKFDDAARKLKEHMASGHPHSKHNPTGKPCKW